jgi:hypothetical protein
MHDSNLVTDRSNVSGCLLSYGKHLLEGDAASAASAHRAEALVIHMQMHDAQPKTGRRSVQEHSMAQFNCSAMG